MVGKIAKGPKQTKKPSKGKGKKVAPPPIPVASKAVAKKPVSHELCAKAFDSSIESPTSISERS